MRCNSHKLFDNYMARCELNCGHEGWHRAERYDGANRGRWNDSGDSLTTLIGVGFPPPYVEVEHAERQDGEANEDSTGDGSSISGGQV